MDPTAIDTVLVAGASGGTGREILRLADSRVPTVRALSRDDRKRQSLLEAGADEVVIDDLLDPRARGLAAVVEGVDAVLSAVGSGFADIRSGGPFVDGQGVQTLLDAAADAGVRAFVMESAIGVGEDPASPLASLFNTVIGPVQRAKGETEAALRASGLEHTVFRPGVLTGGPRTDTVTVADPGAKLWGTVSRADVARLMLAAPVTPAATDRTFEVVGKPTLRDRGEAVDWRLPSR
jgi:uncharacterized protein YbjT (DUF2867 family)